MNSFRDLDSGSGEANIESNRALLTRASDLKLGVRKFGNSGSVQWRADRRRGRRRVVALPCFFLSISRPLSLSLSLSLSRVSRAARIT